MEGLRLLFLFHCKNSHVFPTFDFGRINETLKTFFDINNNNDIEYDDESETSMNEDQLSLLNKHTHLRDINYSLILEDDGTNPQSPLHSVKTFEELKLETQLLNGIYYVGCRRPPRIQERVLPQLLVYPPRKLVAQSHNETGKTVNKNKNFYSKYHFKYLGSIFFSNT
jgi:ATP-dependent RNA helicase DDX19/DBP5